jgi:hypothetical protein
MNLEWMDKGDALAHEFLFQLPHPVDALDEEAEMIELSFLSGPSEAIGHFMERQIVAAGGKISVLGIRLPDRCHAEHILIKTFRAPQVAHFERDVAHTP